MWKIVYKVLTLMHLTVSTTPYIWSTCISCNWHTLYVSHEIWSNVEDKLSVINEEDLLLNIIRLSYSGTWIKFNKQVLTPWLGPTLQYRILCIIHPRCIIRPPSSSGKSYVEGNYIYSISYIINYSSSLNSQAAFYSVKHVRVETCCVARQHAEQEVVILCG